MFKMFDPVVEYLRSGELTDPMSWLTASAGNASFRSWRIDDTERAARPDKHMVDALAAWHTATRNKRYKISEMLYEHSSKVTPVMFPTIRRKPKKMKRPTLLCLLAVFLGASNYGHAQVTYDGCHDSHGVAVASVLDYSINDVAIARLEYNFPVIRYNPRVLAQMSQPTRRFFYVHECAHHALQHTVQAPSLQNEREAVCWAIRTMQSDLGLSQQDLRAIQNDIARQGRGDWTHLPGPYRAVDIESCLGSTPVDTQAGFPPGHDMQQCGCWGFNPPLEAPEPLCQSGSVRLNQCAGSCQGGSSPYAYICQ